MPDDCESEITYVSRETVASKKSVVNRGRRFDVQKMDVFGNREDHLKTLFVHDAVANELQRPDIRAWPTS